MKFHYTKPDGWEFKQFEGTPGRMIFLLLSNALRRVANCQVVWKDSLGKTLSREQAEQRLTDGERVRCQIMVGEALGPVSDAQESEAHLAHRKETEESLKRYLSGTGLEADLP